MEATCLKLIARLENSGFAPDNASYDVDCAKDNIADSIRDFQNGVTRLSGADYSDQRTFGEHLVKILGYTQSLSNDIQDIEQALLKTAIALPDGLFDD